MEIGPLISSFLTKDKYNVFYSDIKSTDEIYSEYKNYRNLGTPEEIYRKLVPIDFVIKDTYKEAVGSRRFAVVFSSHVLEHVRDVILHLQDLCSILIDDGFLVMCIPDKRYTFDHFREVTPFRDMIDVYLSGNVNSTARLSFDHHFMYHPCNDPLSYYKDEVSFSTNIENDNQYSQALEYYKLVRDNGQEFNSHNWVFTYTSFIGFLRDGLRAKLLPYTLYYSNPPQSGENEFVVILKKDLAILSDYEKCVAEIKRIISLQGTT